MNQKLFTYFFTYSGLFLICFAFSLGVRSNQIIYDYVWKFKFKKKLY